jgi:hypothetical protein
LGGTGIYSGVTPVTRGSICSKKSVFSNTLADFVRLGWRTWWTIPLKSKNMIEYGLSYLASYVSFTTYGKLSKKMDRETNNKIQRCPLNVAGDFYTRGECMSCEAPEGEAPNLLAPLNDTNFVTHFIRQPATPEEIEQACRAIKVCCVYDVRYGGTDPEVIEQLGNTAKHSDYIIVNNKLVFVGAPQDLKQPTWLWRSVANWLKKLGQLRILIWIGLLVFVYWLGLYLLPSVPYELFRNICEGMTKEEVRSILGEPNEKYDNMWSYYLEEDGYLACLGPMCVSFNDDEKVKMVFYK